MLTDIAAADDTVREVAVAPRLPETVAAGWRCKKRHGGGASFDCGKIRSALNKCFAAVGFDPGTRARVVERITGAVVVKLDGDDNRAPDVEHVQRLVIRQLWLEGLFDHAEHYQNYRELARRVREAETAPVFVPRDSVKPFEYRSVTAFKEAMHKSPWTFKTYDPISDVQDFRVKLSGGEQAACARTVLAISQIEVDVKRFWAQLGRRVPKAEFEQVGYVFADSEVRHFDAYSNILDVLSLNGMFAELKNVPAIRRRMAYIEKAKSAGSKDGDRGFAKSLAMFALLIENVSLFSQFVIMRSFYDQRGVMKNIDNTVQATMKEECHVEGTEVLTPKGWVDFRSITAGDPVIEYDNGVLRATTVRHKTERHYAGPVYAFGAKGRTEEGRTYCVVTPGHDMAYHDRKGKLKKCKAESFLPHNRKYVPFGGKFDGSGLEELTFMDRLKIAIQADGSTLRWTTADGETRRRGVSGGATHTLVLTKQRKIDRLRWILSNLLGVSCAEYPRGEAIEFRLAVDAIGDLKLLDWVDPTDKSSAWCRDFLEEAAHWDGYHIAPTGALGYSSTSRKCLDKVHAVAVLAGYRTTVIRGHEDERKEGFKPCYRLVMRDRDLAPASHAMTKERKEYDGMVYCVTVPSGAIVTRYKDNVIVSGNCVHALFGAWLCNLIKHERPEWFGKKFEDELREVSLDAYDGEMAILDWIFGDGDIGAVSRASLNEFLKDRINQGMLLVGCDPLFDRVGPEIGELEWFVRELAVPTQTDFFWKEPTEYTSNVSSFSAETMW